MVHGDKYDYSKVVYVNNKTKVIIGCPEHGEFKQKPNDHNSGSGCPTCKNIILSKYYSSTTNEFIQKAKLIHGNRFDYSKVKYVNAHMKVIIGCPIHGDFEQKPSGHLNGNGCARCGGVKKLTTEEFILKSRLVHGDKYDYSKVVYVNNSTKVIIGCPIHGDFDQISNYHLRGNGCPKCSCFNYSQKAIAWLEQIAKEHNIYIQHAENIGEYQIPGTRYKADGYCKETNTIYEFYGDIWHGNLNLFEEDELCHPFINESAGNLYKQTKQREEEIKKLGYKIITIWENEYEFSKNNKKRY